MGTNLGTVRARCVPQRSVSRGFYMPRFKKSDLVIVRNVIWTSRKGQGGHILRIKPAMHGRPVNLDKYVVVFPDGNEETMWDIQLEKPILLRADCTLLPRNSTSDKPA